MGDDDERPQESGASGGSGNSPPRRRRQLHLLPRRLRRAVPIPELLKRLIEIHVITDAIREHTIYIYWRDIVGARIADHAWPDSISDGVLVVRAKNSTWLHELYFARGHIVEQVNRCLEAWLGPPSFVSDVRLTLDTYRMAQKPDEVRRELQKRQSAGRPKRPPEKEPTRASQSEQEVICAQTKHIHDDGLRAAIERVRIDWNL